MCVSISDLRRYSLNSRAQAGGYDPEIGKLAYRTRGTVTVGENFSLTQGINPAPNFTGPVLTVTVSPALFLLFPATDRPTGRS